MPLPDLSKMHFLGGARQKNLAWHIPSTEVEGVFQLTFLCSSMFLSRLKNVGIFLYLLAGPPDLFPCIWMPKICKYLIAGSGVGSYITNPQGQQLFASPSPSPWSPYITNWWITEQKILILGSNTCPKVTFSPCTNPLNLDVCSLILSRSKIPSVGQEGLRVWRAPITAGNLEMFARAA